MSEANFDHRIRQAQGLASTLSDTSVNRINRELIAEGLTAEQAIRVLTGLNYQGRIHGLGTPSREEALRLHTTGSGMQAFGGLFLGGEFDQTLVNISPTIVQPNAGPDSLFDVAVVRIPMGPNDIPGLSEVFIAQIYPSSPEARPIDPVSYERLISTIPMLADTAESRRTSAAGWHKANENVTPTSGIEVPTARLPEPDETVVLGRDLSFGELRSRLSGIAQQKVANILIAPIPLGGIGTLPQGNQTTERRMVGGMEVNLTHTLEEDDMTRMLEAARRTGGESGRFSLELKTWNELPQIAVGGKAVAAVITVKGGRSSDPTKKYRPDPREMGDAVEWVALNVNPAQAAEAIKQLWDDGKLDTFQRGSYQERPTRVIIPQSFRDDQGNILSPHQIIDGLVAAHAQEYGNGNYDVYLSGNSPIRLDESGRHGHGPGFNVQLLFDNYQGQ